MDLRQGPISHLHGPGSSRDCSKRTACGSAQIPPTSPRAPGHQAEEERDASRLGTLPRVPPSTVYDMEATMPALAQLVVHHDPLAFSR